MDTRHPSRRTILKSAAALSLVYAAPLRAAGPAPDAITPALIAAATKEGQVTWYTSADLQLAEKVGKAFEQKFPGIRTRVERAGGERIFSRVAQEYAAGLHVPDAVSTGDAAQFLVWKRQGLLAAYVPEDVARHIPAEHRDPDGLYATVRSSLCVMAYNTQFVSSAEAPKSFADLLDPKWKGKMSIAGTSTGVRWIGSTIEIMGREFLDKLAEQDIKVQDMSGAALAGLVASGEVPLSPTIFDADVTVAKQKGAPIEWRPLEPVVTTVGYSGLSSKASHPHAALLFLDYVHSKEGQQLMMKGGLWSPREDTGTREQKFKKIYLDEKYSLEELEVKFSQWENLMRQLLVKRR